jgi:hypothetical protein
MDPEMRRRAHAKAAGLGLSFAEYVRRLVAQDLGGPKPKPDISIMFDLVDSGKPTNIARDEDKMIGYAVWKEYLQDINDKPRQRKRGGKKRGG